MTHSAETQFDIEALKRALEARDAEQALTFYSDDLEHLENDAAAPPKSPRQTGIEYIRTAIEGAAQNGVRLHLDNLVVGDERAACTITCELPDGRRLTSNTIYDLKEGKIVRQLDVQVTGPED
jgi:hypothetical protein